MTRAPCHLAACREERLYDREAVLGRDASSVFPSESKKMGKMDKDAAAAVIGSMQFVTESQARSPWTVLEVFIQNAIVMS